MVDKTIRKGTLLVPEWLFSGASGVPGMNIWCLAPVIQAGAFTIAMKPRTSAAGSA